MGVRGQPMRWDKWYSTACWARISARTMAGAQKQRGPRSLEKILAVHQGRSRGYLGVLVHDHTFRHRDFT
jgi:hypothetical protein